MAGLAVKVPREKLVVALQASVDAEKKKVDPSDDTYRIKAEEKYNAAILAWSKKAAQALVKGPRKATLESWRRTTVTFEVDGLDLPPFPERERSTVEYQDASKIYQLENAIKILNLSEDEFVNASTYKYVVQYL